MGKTLTYKLLEQNCLSGKILAGEEICLKVNQTLTQDTTGTMVYLQLLALDIKTIQTDLSVAYIDHNLLQTGFENADDHAFIQSVAKKYGIVYSKAGGGICHQVHLERFARPSTVLLGSDSHTPSAGGIGALAIGCGGLDVAIAMAKGFYFMKVPKVYQIKLTGKPHSYINGKDIILKILKHLTVQGGISYILEYCGDGIQYLSVTDRATITNMGAECGATSSIFPSDEQTLHFLKRQNRSEHYIALTADEDAIYDQTLSIDLTNLVSQIAQPHMPDLVNDVQSLVGLKIDQVAIGSCTNSSYSDMMKVARILKNKQVAPNVSLVISPGSANILRLMSENGALSTLLAAGARILESACGPCIGMGQAPKTDAISLRTFNRNFKGRSGTMSAQVYLVSPETAAYSAIMGVLSDPVDLKLDLTIEQPDSYGQVDSYFIMPQEDQSYSPIEMGPNIKPLPKISALSNQISGKILLKGPDNVTTDDIVPSHAKLLPYRSNIPFLASYCLSTIDPEFATRAIDNQGGLIVAGENYGQGSSREHAALVPAYLKIKAVIAKSYARIHRSNLINMCILPFVFIDHEDYNQLSLDDDLVIEDLMIHLESDQIFTVKNITQGKQFKLSLNLSERELAIIKQAGYLNFIKHFELDHA